MGEGCGGGIGREEGSGSGHDEKRGDGEHGEGGVEVFIFSSYFDEKKIKKNFFG